jgi:hypothetical protein
LPAIRPQSAHGFAEACEDGDRLDPLLRPPEGHLHLSFVPALASVNGETTKPLRDLLDGRDFPYVHADHPLYVALERMGTVKLDLLPIVSRADIHYLMGVVFLADVLNSYGLKHRH